jgi:hypothetical protein
MHEMVFFSFIDLMSVERDKRRVKWILSFSSLSSIIFHYSLIISLSLSCVRCGFEWVDGDGRNDAG